jgi:hypothetical protein
MYDFCFRYEYLFGGDALRVETLSFYPYNHFRFNTTTNCFDHRIVAIGNDVMFSCPVLFNLSILENLNQLFAKDQDFKNNSNGNNQIQINQLKERDIFKVLSCSIKKSQNILMSNNQYANIVVRSDGRFFLYFCYSTVSNQANSKIDQFISEIDKVEILVGDNDDGDTGDDLPSKHISSPLENEFENWKDVSDDESDVTIEEISTKELKYGLLILNLPDFRDKAYKSCIDNYNVFELCSCVDQKLNFFSEYVSSTNLGCRYIFFIFIYLFDFIVFLGQNLLKFIAEVCVDSIKIDNFIHIFDKNEFISLMNFVQKESSMLVTFQSYSSSQKSINNLLCIYSMRNCEFKDNNDSVNVPIVTSIFPLCTIDFGRFLNSMDDGSCFSILAVSLLDNFLLIIICKKFSLSNLVLLLVQLCMFFS